MSVTTAAGVSGTVLNPTTTPAITVTLGAITPSSVAASGTVAGSNLSGTNTGDQSSIVGITGTKAQFDTAVSDGNILYVGDITQYTDELAQDAVGAMVDASLTYVDATPLLQRAALTGAITVAAGSNATVLGSFTSAQLNAAISDGDFQPLDTQLTDLAGLTYVANALKVVRVNAGATAFELATPSGGAGGATYGTATLDFGAFPGANEASVAFADAGVGAGSKVDVFMMGDDTTADHTASDHRYAGQLFSLSAAPVAGVGGTIYGRSIHKMQGTFAVRWAWAA